MLLSTLLLVGGCGDDPSTTPDTSAQPSQTPASDRKVGRSTLDVVGPRYARLQPGDQVEWTGRGDHVYVGLGNIRFGMGNANYPRSISIAIGINNDGPPFAIDAYYKSDSGRVGPLEPASYCWSGAGLVPSRIRRGADPHGCLSYFIPGDAGRLILDGNANFRFYVTVREQAER